MHLNIPNILNIFDFSITSQSLHLIYISEFEFMAFLTLPLFIVKLDYPCFQNITLCPLHAGELILLKNW